MKYVNIMPILKRGNDVRSYSLVNLNSVHRKITEQMYWKPFPRT